MRASILGNQANEGSNPSLPTWETDDYYCEEHCCWHEFIDGDEVYVKTYIFPGGEDVWYGVYCKKHAPEGSSLYKIKLLNEQTSGVTQA